MKRPLLLPIILFLLGVILADKVLTDFSLALKIALPVLILTFVFLIASIKTKKLFSVVLLFLFFALGVFRLSGFMNVWENDIRQFRPVEDDKVFVEGIVTSEPVYSKGEYFDKVSFYLDAKRLLLDKKETPVSGKVKVDLYDPRDDVNIGDILVAEGKLSIPRGRTNPAGFDYKNFLKYQGVGAILTSSKNDLISEIGVSKDPVLLARRHLSLAKQKALEVIGKNLTGEKRALVDSTLLGRRQGMSDETKDLFAKTGTMHIIAVSGLHVGIIGGAMLAVLLLIRMPKKFAYLLTIIGIFSFAVMSGARPSAMRAAIMLSFLLLSQLLNRRIDLVSSLFLSAFIILFSTPGQLFTPGFILSYMAVLSIIYLTPVFDSVIGVPSENVGGHSIDVGGASENVGGHSIDVGGASGPEQPPSLRGTGVQASSLRGGRRPTRQSLHYLQKSISVSLAVWIGTLPIVTSYFNIISPSVVIANLIAIPVLFVLIILGGMLVALGFFDFLSVFAGYVAVGISWIIDAYFLVLGAISKCPFAYFKIASPSGIVIAGYYALMVLLLISIKSKTSSSKGFRTKMLIFFLAAANLFVWNQVVKGLPPKGVEITFFDTGKADAALMEFPDGEVVLVDGASGGFETGRTDHGRNVIAPYLTERGISKIDCVILSHPHEDHIGGLFYITQNFDVGTLVTGDQNYSESWYYRDYLELAEQKGIKHIRVTRGDIVSGIDDTTLYVFNPPKESYDDLNNDSLVFKLSYVIGGSEPPSVIARSEAPSVIARSEATKQSLTILFTGDIGEDAMKDILQFGEYLKSDILKAPHHGQLAGDAGTLKVFTKACDSESIIITNKSYRKVHKIFREGTPETTISLTGAPGFVKITEKAGNPINTGE